MKRKIARRRRRKKSTFVIKMWTKRKEEEYRLIAICDDRIRWIAILCSCCSSQSCIIIWIDKMLKRVISERRKYDKAINVIYDFDIDDVELFVDEI